MVKRYTMNGVICELTNDNMPEQVSGYVGVIYLATDYDALATRLQSVQAELDILKLSAKQANEACEKMHATWEPLVHRCERLEAKLDRKNVKIGRLNDDVRRLTKAVEYRDQSIKDLRHDLARSMTNHSADLTAETEVAQTGPGYCVCHNVAQEVCDLMSKHRMPDTTTFSCQNAGYMCEQCGKHKYKHLGGNLRCPPPSQSDAGVKL